MVVAETLESALKSEEVLNYWKTNDFAVLGIATFEHVDDPSKYEDTFRTLPVLQKQMLLLSFSGELNPPAWIASNTDSADSQFVWSQVRVGNQSNNRRKHDKISFVHASKIGVSFDDEVGNDEEYGQQPFLL